MEAELQESIPSNMRALRVQSLGGWDIRLDEVSVPEPGSGQLLVRSEAIGLCGSDVHACRGDAGYEWLTLPVTLGHEVAGKVVAQGSDVEDEWVGRRIAMVAIQGCGQCGVCTSGNGNYCPNRTCLGFHSDGGLAEYFVIDAARVVPVSTETSATLAAMYEPVAIIQHTLDSFPTNLAGAKIGVTGPGTIGLLSGLECARRGATVTIFGRSEGDEIRLECAEQLGLIVGHETDEAFDFWVEASGSEGGLNRAIGQCANRASITVPGLFGWLPEVPMNRLVRGGISLHGSYGYLIEHYQRAAEFVTDYEDRLQRMITVFSMNEAEQALRATAAGDVIKAVVCP